MDNAAVEHIRTFVVGSIVVDSHVMNIKEFREFFPMNIGPEQAEDYREVENLVRGLFWNVYRPGRLRRLDDKR